MNDYHLRNLHLVAVITFLAGAKYPNILAHKISGIFETFPAILFSS